MTQETHPNGNNPKANSIKAEFRAMLAPTTKAVSRKAWGIDVSTVWLPYFTAAKVVGAVDDVDLPDAALGAPFLVKRDKDTQEPLFDKNGRPRFETARQLNTMVNRAKDNYTAGLIQRTAIVVGEQPEAYKAQVERQCKAGQPVIDNQDFDIAQAVEAALSAEMALLDCLLTPEAAQPAPEVAKTPAKTKTS